MAVAEKKVSGQVYVCSRYRFYLFVRCWEYILVV